jgi:hypothetical protein
MNAGTEPPHWNDLLKYSSKTATDENFDLAQEWMSTNKMQDQVSMPTAGGHITDPFVVVMEMQQMTSPAGTTTLNGPSSLPYLSRSSISDATQVSKGGNKRTSAEVSSSSNAAANSKSKARCLAPTDDAMANIRDDFGPSAAPDPSPQNNLMMPQRINLHEAGLRGSP